MNQNSRFSIGYFLLKVWVRFGLRIFYRRITVVGEDNLPETGGVILFSNHQNAMLDPFQLCCFTKRQLHWLARADVFKKKSHARILNHLNIIPIHRKRDNIDLQSESEKTFAICLELLKQNTAIAMFPEGGHHDEKYIRPFKTGMSRIVASASRGEKINLIPVYIDYHGTSFRHEVLIRFGKSKVYSPPESTTEDPVTYVRNSTQTAYEDLRSLAVHIPDRQMADQFELLRPVIAAYFTGNDEINSEKEFELYKSITDKIVARCETEPSFRASTIAALENCVKELPSLEKSIDRKKRDSGISMMSFVLNCLGPVSVAFHILPWLLSRNFTRSFVKDHHFFDSVLLITGLLSFNIYYFLILLFVFLFTPGLTTTFLTLLFLIITGVLSLKWYDLKSEKFPAKFTNQAIPMHQSFVSFFSFIKRENITVAANS